MAKFSVRSLERLATCDERLQRVCHEAMRTLPEGWDFTVLCGHRTKVEQDAAVRAGSSKTPWPKSKHNALPSKAVDLAPYPIDWNDLQRFRDLAAHVLTTGKRLGIKLRWGADWNMNGRTDDERFIDMPHFELVDA